MDKLWISIIFSVIGNLPEESNLNRDATIIGIFTDLELAKIATNLYYDEKCIYTSWGCGTSEEFYDIIYEGERVGQVFQLEVNKSECIDV